MINYKLKPLTDSYDFPSVKASRKGLAKALADNAPLSDETKQVIRHIAQRDWGNATVAQGLFLLATMQLNSPDKVVTLEPIDVIPSMMKARLDDGQCTQPLTTKELNVMIRVVNGKIKHAAQKMVWILGMSSTDLRHYCKESILATRCTERGDTINLPPNGVNGLSGFFRVGELLPFIGKFPGQEATDDQITDMWS